MTRYEYRTPEDIRRVIGQSASLGFSSVFFQVRGNGTVYYDSALETWSEVHNFIHPGFDPLAIAVEEAHARGMELHAWVNIMPGWRGSLQRAAPRQLVKIRPSWFLGRKESTPIELGGSYYWLNPCLPEVRNYLVSLCQEIVTKYDVDGLHLDHIRLADLSPEDHAAIPGDPRSLELFRAWAGAFPDASKLSLKAWKAECVTQLVREISTAVRGGGRAILSAAVMADPAVGRDRYCQDWEVWAREGLLDAIVPMNYEDSDTRFRRRLEAGLLGAQGLSVIEGIALYKHESPDQTIRQIKIAQDAGAAGVSLFSYSQLFRADDFKARKRRFELSRFFRKGLPEGN